MAQRIFALADGDVFGAMGGEDEVPRCAQICLVFGPGTVELSAVDRPGAAGGTQETVKKQGTGMREQGTVGHALPNVQRWIVGFEG